MRESSEYVGKSIERAFCDLAGDDIAALAANQNKEPDNDSIQLCFE